MPSPPGSLTHAQIYAGSMENTPSGRCPLPCLCVRVCVVLDALLARLMFGLACNNHIYFCEKDQPLGVDIICDGSSRRHISNSILRGQGLFGKRQTMCIDMTPLTARQVYAVVTPTAGTPRVDTSSSEDISEWRGQPRTYYLHTRCSASIHRVSRETRRKEQGREAKQPRTVPSSAAPLVITPPQTLQLMFSRRLRTVHNILRFGWRRWLSPISEAEFLTQKA